MYCKYYALSDTGSEIKGSMEGSPEIVEKSLKKDGFYIVSVRPDILMSASSSFTKRKLKARNLSAFFAEMAGMLHLGIAVNEIVDILKNSSVAPELTKSLDSIGGNIRSGFSLAASFDKAKVFPRLAISMLKIGEKSGNLEKVLEDLSRHYSREADFIAGLKSALVYPLIVFLMLIGIMFYISFKVIPHLEALLPIQSNRYFATRMLLSLSHFLKDYWYVLIILPIFLIFLYSSLIKRGSNKTMDYYRLPVIGEIAKDIFFTTLFSNMALLQRNGISIIDSLTLIEETIHYKIFAKKISKIKDCVTSGVSLWQAFGKDPFFSSRIPPSVRKGEETGSLDMSLEGISKYYFDKATRRIHVILSLIQPVLLVVCACVLLFIISAFIIPVYSNLSNIAGGNVKF